MPDNYCSQCGTNIRPTDLFCRNCGFALDSTTVAAQQTPSAKLERSSDGLAGRGVIPPPKSSLSIFTACLVAASLVFLTLTLAVVAVLFLVNQMVVQPGGRPAIAIEQIGTSTPYPTRAPYRTDIPYKTATPYPTAASYPTTGPFSTATPGQPFQIVPPIFFYGCQLRIKNQNPDLDSVVILSNVDTNAIMAAMYVRANDSFNKSGISSGSYYAYVALGLDWDNTTGRFKNNAFYFRFEEPASLNMCPTLYGSYDFYEIILNSADETGSNTIYVQPGSFPSISP
jgi:hypothetical protein